MEGCVPSPPDAFPGCEGEGGGVLTLPPKEDLRCFSKIDSKIVQREERIWNKNFIVIRRRRLIRKLRLERLVSLF